MRDVSVDGFGVSARLVTNEEFDAFVSATGHVTDAERFGWSFVFKDFVSVEVEREVSQVVQGSEWWWRVDGSCWREPEGPWIGCGGSWGSSGDACFVAGCDDLLRLGRW